MIFIIFIIFFSFCRFIFKWKGVSSFASTGYFLTYPTTFDCCQPQIFREFTQISPRLLGPGLFFILFYLVGQMFENLSPVLLALLKVDSENKKNHPQGILVRQFGDTSCNENPFLLWNVTSIFDDPVKILIIEMMTALKKS